MESLEVACVICSDNRNDRTILFTEKSLNRCHELLKIHRDNNLEYKNVILPSRVNRTDGYHVTCYINFTALRGLSNMTCVFCGKHGKDNLILFTHKLLQKCRDALQIRKERKCKYKDVVLPSTVNTTDRYHSKCYVKFSASINVNRKQTTLVTVEPTTTSGTSTPVNHTYDEHHQKWNHLKNSTESSSADEITNLKKSPMKCTICGEGGDDNIILFTENSLQKCNEVLRLRKGNRLPFTDVILPSRVSTTEGYHAKCYKNFTVMRLPKILCVICGERRDESSLWFTEKSLEKCRELLKIRKDNGLKFSNVELPPTVNLTHGYHVKCYTSFTGSIRFHEKFKSLTKDQSTKLGASISLRDTHNESQEAMGKIDETSAVDPVKNLEENITCFICCTVKDENAILFTENSLQKCTYILRIRRDNKLQFKDVILPPRNSTTGGYHAMCYKNFTSLMCLPKISCVICGECGSEKPVWFTKESLEECRKALKINGDNGLKFTVTDVSSAANWIHGYHTNCYANFTTYTSHYYCEKPKFVTGEQSTTLGPSTPTRSTPNEDDQPVIKIKQSSPFYNLAENLDKNITCIICGEYMKKKTISCTEKSSQKSNEVLLILKDSKQQSQVTISASRVRLIDCYHTTCYKNFTASRPLPKIFCVFCGERNDEKSIWFTEKSLHECRKLLQIHRENGLKFKDVVLPPAVNLVSGYHTKCYADFTSISGYCKNSTSITDDQSTSLRENSIKNTHEHHPLAKNEQPSLSADAPGENPEKNMSSSAIACGICGERRDENSTWFTELSLEECRKLLKIRKDSGLIFADIVLPSAANVTHGYHVKCHTNVTTFMRNYGEKSASVAEEQSSALGGSDSAGSTHNEVLNIEAASPSTDSPAVNLEENVTCSTITCFICGQNKDEKLILFTEELLQKCNQVLRVRKDNKLQFSTITLPSTVSMTDGYHTTCYTNFIALTRVPKILCVICGERGDENSRWFTEESLKKCRDILQIRKENGLRFKDVVLPSAINLTHGYHIKCYTNFTSLLFYYTEKIKSVAQKPSASAGSTHNGDHQPVGNIEPSPAADCPGEQLEKSTTSSIRCFVCGPPKGEKLKLFSEQSLQKCKQVLLIRKNNGLRFSNVILPFVINTTDGYHTKCYKKFTDLRQFDRRRVEAVAEDQSVTPEASASVETSHDGFYEVDRTMNTPANLENLEVTKKYDETIETISVADEQSLGAIVEDDSGILEPSKALTTETSDVSYHESIKQSHHEISKEPLKPSQFDWQASRDHHKTAYSEVSKLIDENVIKKGQCYFLNFLCYYYLDVLRRVGEKNLDTCQTMSPAKHLKVKMLNSFGDQIKIVTVNNERKVIAPREHEGFDDEAFSQLEEEEALQKAALLLRNKVLEMRNQSTPGVILSNKSQGKQLIPESLINFSVSLLGGTHGEKRKSYDCKIAAESLSRDVINAISNGRIENEKHMAFGVPPSNLEKSCRIVDDVNNYDYCSNSHVKEELDIESDSMFIAMSHSNVCLPGDQISSDTFAGIEVDDSTGLVKTEPTEETSVDKNEFVYQVVDRTDDAEADEINEAPRVKKGVKRKSSDDEPDEFD